MSSSSSEVEKPSLFNLLATLTMEQRQEFGEIRRKLKEDKKVIEEILQDKKTGEWFLGYSKAKKEVAEIRFGKQELKIKKTA